MQTPDGTTYRLGYTGDSQTGQLIREGTLETLGNQNQGESADYGGLRWRVDTVTDVHGNQIQYDYFQWLPDPEEYGPTSISTHRSEISEIRYNYVNLASSPYVRVTTGTFASKIQFVLTGLEHRIDEIKLYHLNLVQPYRKIDVILGSVSHTNSGCNPSGDTVTLYVDQIQEKSGDGTLSLPLTDFTYVAQRHGDNSTQCFYYEYLQEVVNNYGGRIKFTYTGDNRVVSDGDIAILGQSYYVNMTETWDGVHAQPAVTTYNFPPPDNSCYDEYNAEGGTDPTHCPTRDYFPGGSSFEYGPGRLVGFGQAQITRKDYDGTVLNYTISRFWKGLDPNRNKMGRPYQTQLYNTNVSGVLLQQQDISYATDKNGPPTTFDFTYTSSVDTTTYARGGQSTVHRVTYEYARQNNVQYGNQTAAVDHGDLALSGDEKRLERDYYVENPPATKWLVGFHGQERVLSGTTPSAPVQAITRYYYDNQASWTNFPLKGNVTKVERAKTTSPTTTFITVQQSQYDSYGNVTQVTDALSHNTATSYDLTYHLYPLAITNHLNQQQALAYYGLNASPPFATNSPPGLLQQVTDVPNNFSVLYVYDYFGRLIQLFRGWNEQGADQNKPSEAYHYADFDYYNNQWPLRITAWRKTQDNGAQWTSGGAFERQLFDGFGNPIQTQRPHTDWSGNALGGVADTGQRIAANVTYNAAGQAVSEGNPYFAAGYSGSGTFQVASPPGEDLTTARYDAAGRPVRVVAPDAAASSIVYGRLSAYFQDGENHVKASYFNFDEQLTAVDETVDTFSTTFDDGSSLSNWTQFGAGSISVVNGAVRLANTSGDWTGISRSHSGTTGDGATFSFRTDNTGGHSQMLLSYGTWNTSAYRQWGLQVNAGSLNLLEWAGDATPTNGTTTTLMPVQANTWYRALLRVSQSTDEFVIVVWEEGKPELSAEVRKSKDATWQQSNWTFTAKTASAYNLDFDNYDELNFNRTRYIYDTLGNLTQVTDPAGRITTMGYNALSWKTSMTDPNMGAWSYTYDDAGNLKTQLDAKNQTIAFTYDALNRLTEKRLGVGGSLLASYSYDSTTGGNKGVGRRTGMTAYSPPGVFSNSASWVYDSQGRVTSEQRIINITSGNKTYNWAFTYTQGDLPLSITYPGGSAGQSGEMVVTDYWWPAAGSEVRGRG
ncbi:MAG: hypothetical protein L0322_31680 [Chloroflexi bacterium]|nr:hypothetical protein [Chloroflexota bacterium]